MSTKETLSFGAKEYEERLQAEEEVLEAWKRCLTWSQKAWKEEAVNKLTQFEVSWGDKKVLVYAKNGGEAKKQVGAPLNATVRESYLTDKDIKKLLSRGL